MIIGNAIGVIIRTPDTLILIDDEVDKEYTAVSTNKEVDLDATANDIRLGTTAATNTGVTPGEMIVPNLRAIEGYSLIDIGKQVVIDNHDYTKLLATIGPFNGSEESSVSVEKVVINNKVYNVRSSESISNVIVNLETNQIDFGLTNDSNSTWIVRYFLYKEIE